MKNKILVKLLVIGVLIGVLLIPGFLVQNLIRDRKSVNQEVESELTDKWGGKQEVGTPYLSIPYELTGKNDDGKSRYLNITPTLCQVKYSPQATNRGRGVHKEILYQGMFDSKGSFDINAVKELAQQSDVKILWDQIEVLMPVSDHRGIHKLMEFKLDDKRYTMKSERRNGNDIFKTLVLLAPELIASSDSVPFEMQFELSGLNNLQVYSIADHTIFDWQVNWSTVGYVGTRLPSSNTFDDGCAKAHWDFYAQESNKIKNTNHNYRQGSFNGEIIEVMFKPRVDHYHKLMRASKYAVMFIALTFAVFFFVEIINSIRIHPVQYLLVGFALLLFYTLLLSFAEHVSFDVAYIVSAVSIICLICLYTKGITNSVPIALVMLGALVVLYLFLYVILQLEEASLLMGSIGLFCVLALGMYFTRNVNWYE